MSTRLRTRRSSGLFSSLNRQQSSGTWRSNKTAPPDAETDNPEHEFDDLSRVNSHGSEQSQAPLSPTGETVIDGFDNSNEDSKDDSSYPEVRAAVSASDDITLSINTPRMWILSLLFAVLGSATNMFFSLRYPSVTITPVIALLLVHPLGLLWDQLLKRASDTPLEFFNGTLQSVITEQPAMNLPTRWRVWLGQGRWNEKEHACVYISSNVAFGFAFATDVRLHIFNSCSVLIAIRSLLSRPCSTSKKRQYCTRFFSSCLHKSWATL